MASKMQTRLQKLWGVFTTQRDWQSIEFSKTTHRDNLRLIMRGYANKTSRKKKGRVRSPGDAFTWNYKHILCPRCVRKVASKGALVPLKRSAKVRARLIHRVMGDPRRRALSEGSCKHLPKTSSRCESPTDDRAASKIAGLSLSRMENSRRNIMGTQAESAKKKSFHFDRGETGYPKFKLRLQVHHAILCAITLSLLSNFSTKLNCRLVYWPWRPWRAHFITACNT